MHNLFYQLGMQDMIADKSSFSSPFEKGEDLSADQLLTRTGEQKRKRRRQNSALE